MSLPFSSLLKSVRTKSVRTVTTSVTPAGRQTRDISFSSICCAKSRDVMCQAKSRCASFSRLAKGAVTILRKSRDSLVTSNRGRSCNVIDNTAMGQFGGTSDTVVRLGGGNTSIMVVSAVVTRVCYQRASKVGSVPMRKARRSAMFYIRGKGDGYTRLLGGKLGGMGRGKACSRLCTGCFSKRRGSGIRVARARSGGIKVFKALGFVFMSRGH